MTLEQEYTLSFYREITEINRTHRVSLVQHTETQQLFVKKVLTYYHPDVLSRLRSHPVPGVPKIHELIQDGDTLIVIEDYIHGETVAQLLERRGTLSEEESISIIRQLCGILRPLHAASPPIVHRDIKPSNLILSQDGTLYLIDFNAAKTSQQSASRDTDLIGTHGYAAPEQYGFAPSGPGTDILRHRRTVQRPAHRRFSARPHGIRHSGTHHQDLHSDRSRPTVFLRQPTRRRAAEFLQAGCFGRRNTGTRQLASARIPHKNMVENAARRRILRTDAVAQRVSGSDQ